MRLGEIKGIVNFGFFLVKLTDNDFRILEFKEKYIYIYIYIFYFVVMKENDFFFENLILKKIIFIILEIKEKLFFDFIKFKENYLKKKLFEVREKDF